MKKPKQTKKEKSHVMQIGDVTLEPAKEGKLKITVGKVSSEVSYKELWGAVWYLGDVEFRDEMLPVQKKEMMQFARVHTIEATHDIKKGERLQVHCEVNIPQTIVNAIAKKEGAKVIMPTEELPPQKK